VALVMPTPNETYVFFDDSRYMLEDGASAAAFREHLAESVRRSRRRTLLVMADRRVTCGGLTAIAALARLSGVRRVLIANKRREARSE
jgi:biopolymer transport protein ExbD